MNAVVSRPIAEEFHKRVGDTLNVGGNDVKIVGIYYCGSLLLDVAIILDINEVRRMSRFGTDSVSAYYIEQTGDVSDASADTADSGRLQRAGNPALAAVDEPRIARRRATWSFDLFARFPEPTAASHSASSAAPGPIRPAVRKPPNGDRACRSRFAAPADWAARFQDFSADLDLFLTIMSAIGVTIAVLSIVNTMLMSVTERIIEFGILKANGWSRYDVMRLITSESAVLGFCGGISGCLVGWVGTGDHQFDLARSNSPRRRSRLAFVRRPIQHGAWASSAASIRPSGRCG